MRVTETGDLLVSTRGDGEVILLYKDTDGDGKADGRQVLLSELNVPTGLEIHEGWLYVGEKDAIGRIEFDASARATRGSYQHIVEGCGFVVVDEVTGIGQGTDAHAVNRTVKTDGSGTAIDQGSVL